MKTTRDMTLRGEERGRDIEGWGRVDAGRNCWVFKLFGVD